MRKIIPDFILTKFNNGEYKGNFLACTMFLDLSAFAKMTQTLMKNGKEGAEVLSEIINRVFTPAIDTIYRSKGFISTFSGDAYNALFPFTATNENLVINRVLQTAEEIQYIYKHYLGHQKTKFGEFNLSVKIGISIGDIDWEIIPGKLRNCYYFRSEAINRCANNEHYAEKGEIIVGNCIREKISKASYLLEEKEKNIFCISPRYPSRITSPPHQKNQLLRIENQWKFVPESILNLIFKGEFRNIIASFITFQNNDNFELKIATLLQLANRYGGYLNKIDFCDKGGVILVLFGAPVEKEKLHIRACDFALELNQHFPARISLTAGNAYTGFIGSILQQEYTAIGDSVNLSSRINLIAKYGEVYIDDSIKEKIKEIYNTKYISDESFKGFEENTPIYLLQNKRQENKFYFSGKMIGRSTEMKLLEKITNPIFKNKTAGVIYIDGIAGIGKSRLSSEYKKQMGSIVKWLYLPCDEILRKSFNPIVYFLNFFFKQDERNSELENKKIFEIVYDNLINKTKIDIKIQEELVRTKSILGALLNFHWQDSLYQQLDSKSKYENTLYALENFVRALTLERPIIIELEDGHWIDADTQKFISLLTSKIPELPLAIISSCRYKDDGSLFHFILENKKTPLHRINLNFLTKEGVGELIIDKLEPKQLPENLLEFIYHKSGGIPFYIEQIILYLQEHSLLDDKLEIMEDKKFTIPESINSIIIARVDRLTRELKTVLKIASVLGREFAVKLLADILPKQNLKKEVGVYLARGKYEEIWTPLSELKYIFKHALIRDAIYEMQLKKEIRKLHIMAAEAIETIYKENLEKHYFELAEHYQKGEIADKTIFYLAKAGDYAAENFKNIEALNFYNRLWVILEDKQQIIDTLFKIAIIHEASGEWEICLTTLKKAIIKAKEIGGIKKTSELEVKMGRILEKKGDYKEGIEISNLVIDKIENSSNFSEPDFQRIYSSGINNLAIIYFRQGQYLRALKLHHKALKIKEKIKDIQGVADCLSSIGTVNINLGNYEESLTYQQKSLKMKEKLDYKTGIGSTLNNIGILFYEKNDYETGLDYQNRSLKIFKLIGARDYWDYNYAYISYGHAKLKQHYKALETALLHFIDIKEVGTYAEKGRTHLSVALVLADVNYTHEDKLFQDLLNKITALTKLKKTAISYFEFAINTAAADNYLETLIPALSEYGRYLYLHKEKNKGKELLQKAEATAVKSNMSGEIKKINKIRKELSMIND